MEIVNIMGSINSEIKLVKSIKFDFNMDKENVMRNFEYYLDQRIALSKSLIPHLTVTEEVIDCRKHMDQHFLEYMGLK